MASADDLITTNLAFKQWGTVFPGAACVAALIDRFNQHCHKLLITADSWCETHPFDHNDDPADPTRPRKQR
jgi:DNA replication protein DnaC